MEATACFKNLIPKAICDAFSVMLVTQTTLGPRWEGTTQGHRPGGGSHGHLHVDHCSSLLPRTAPPPQPPPGVPNHPVSTAHSNPSETSQSMSFS